MAVKAGFRDRLRSAYEAGATDMRELAARYVESKREKREALQVFEILAEKIRALPVRAKGET